MQVICTMLACCPPPPPTPPPPAGYSSKRFIFERAKELGVRSVVIDGPDSWSRVGGPLHVCASTFARLAVHVCEPFAGLDMCAASTS